MRRETLIVVATAGATVLAVAAWRAYTLREESARDQWREDWSARGDYASARTRAATDAAKHGVQHLTDRGAAPASADATAATPA